MKQINFGDTLTCAETGKTFIAAIDGCSTNYACDSKGNVYSDEGVDICARRELLDRSKPYTCYLSSDGKHVTGWKNNVLGIVVDWCPCKLTRRSYIHGKEYRSVSVVDVHGGKWYGRGSPGIVITLRAKK